MLLLSACRLTEEPVQQAKGAFALGDVVFDAQDISKAAVMQCTNADCTTKQIVPSTLHQVALSGDPIAGVLQFDYLHISFQSGNKVYTCLRRSAPLGMMTPLWRSSDNKYCYEQAKDKDYVQQFAVACAKERDWQLIAASGINNLEKFACKKDAVEISSECFVVGNTANCDTSDWLKEIKDIYANVGTAGVATVDGQEKQEINADTKLKDVKIMAEWKLYGGYGGTGIVKCIGIEKTRDFTGSSSKLEVSEDYHEDGTIDDFLISFNCQKSASNDALNVASYGDKEHENYNKSPGICVATSQKNATDTLDKCTTQADYIKITFEAK